ncbi:MAG: hypothetical protein U1C97_02365, partial [Candidatus Gracilibacteria bacterium]|nr:hypothetical protein [Candidatus Gracilibacteria bacterium]
MRIFRPFIALLLSILLSAPLPSVFAQADLTDFSADDVGAPSMNFTIDQDGTAGAGDTVILKFGEVLSEILQFDVDAARFELSDDLSLEGNQLVDFKIENQASDPAACAEGVKGRVYYNTTNNRLWYCNASTWVDVTQDFESVFGTDTDKTITTTNTDLTVDTGTEDFVVDSNDWSVDQSGNLSIGGTLNANGVATLGDGGDTVAIDSSVWDISSAGVASGFTGFTSSGIIDFSVASQLRVPGTSEDSFVVNTDGDDATLQFGQNTDGQISYNDASNSFDFDGNLLMNLEDPVNDQDAVTKAYLDAAQAGEAMQGHVSNLGQLVDGGAGVGGVKAGTHTQVTDETLVLENDTFTITYNSGGSTIVLAAKDAPTAANCEFASGAT